MVRTVVGGFLQHCATYRTKDGIVTEEGSDKGSGWHNYTLLYHFLFHSRRHNITNVFEVGLGTNFIDTPSNMGSHPPRAPGPMRSRPSLPRSPADACSAAFFARWSICRPRSTDTSASTTKNPNPSFGPPTQPHHREDQARAPNVAVDLPRFRGEMRAWDQALWLYVMLSSGSWHSLVRPPAEPFFRPDPRTDAAAARSGGQGRPLAAAARRACP
jgi:hypothetical protein